MNIQVVEQILEQYGVTAQQIMPVQKGYRNESYGIEATDDKNYNLILYKQELGIVDTIKRANLASNHVAAAGLPSRQTQSNHIIKLSAKGFEQYGALYNYLPGKTIPWEAYTQTHIKLLGLAMAKMHTVLTTLPTADFPLISRQLVATLERMQQYFTNSGVVEALETKTHTLVNPAKLTPYIGILRDSPQKSQQVLHMDFVRGNVLFEPSASGELWLDDLSISGILDFEKVACGRVEFDVARTLAFLLVDCKYKPADKVRKYFLESGYRKRGGGQELDLDLLEQLIDIFLLYDFYKFLLHNPYEFLYQNEHFVRTRDILLERKVISAI